MVFVTPNIRQEIIAQPRAEIIDIGVNFSSEGLERDQKIRIIMPVKNKIIDLIGTHLKYVYSDIRPNMAFLSLHLNSYQDFDYVFDTLNKAVAEKQLADITIDPWVTSSLNISAEPAIEMFFNDVNEEVNREYLESTLAFVKKHPLVKQAKGVPDNSLSEVVHMDFNKDNFDLLLSDKNYEIGSDKLNNFVKYALEPQKLYDMDIGAGLMALKLKVKTQTPDLDSILALPYKISNQEIFIDQLYKVSSEKVWRNFFSNNAIETYRIAVWAKTQVSTAEVKTLERDIKNHLKESFNLSMMPISFKDTGINTRTALLSVQYSLLFSILLVFLVLLYQFKRIQITAIVMSVIPFGICGSLIGLYCFNSTLSLNSFLGMLIVAGLSVNNSIIIVEDFNHFFVKGHSQFDSIVKSIRSRMRALLVTNLTTIGGMLPLAIGFGPGKDILQPLGISVSFGLVFAAVCSIVIIPLLLSYPSVIARTDKKIELLTDNEVVNEAKAA